MSSDNHHEYPVIEGNAVHDPDDLNRIKRVIQAAKEDTEIFPHLNNFNPHTQSWDPAIGARARRPRQARRAAPADSALLRRLPVLSRPFAGLSRTCPTMPIPAYLSFIQELYADLHARNLRLYVNTAVCHHRRRPQADCRQLRRHHPDELRRAPDRERSRAHRQPGLVRRQSAPRAQDRAQGEADLRRRQLRLRLDALDSQSQRTSKHPQARRSSTPKISTSPTPGSAPPTPTPTSISITTPSIPTSSTSTRTSNQRHVVWFLDGVTLLNELRAARAARPADLRPLAPGRGRQLAVERLGQAQQPGLAAGARLRAARPRCGQRGRRRHHPRHRPAPARQAHRHRSTPTSPTRARSSSSMSTWTSIRAPTPSSSTATTPTKSRSPSTTAPTPSGRPRFSTFCSDKNVKGTFMLIGAEAAAERRPDEARRARRPRDRQPHLHPSRHQRNLQRASSIWNSSSPSASSPASWACSRSTSALPTTSMRSRTPTTRPRPSSAFRRPATPSSAARSTPTTGTSIRARRRPRSPQSVLDQLETMKTKPQFRGSIILLHDGGGDRSATVAALPVLIDALRAHGYTIVPVSALMGKTTAEVMPKLTFTQYLRALPDSIAFSSLAIIGKFIVLVFFVGDVLMSARLLLVGILAIIDRLRKPHAPGLARLQSARRRPHPRLQRRDGHRPHHPLGAQLRLLQPPRHRHRRRLQRPHRRSRPRGLRRRNRRRPRPGAHQAQRRQGRRAQLRPRPPDEEIYVGIDADTVIAPDAISKLIPHFEDPLHRRRRRQRQGRQPRQSLDPLAGSRIHHQPELRAPRPGSVQRRHRRPRRHRRMAHRARSKPPAATPSTPSPKTPTSPWPCSNWASRSSTRTARWPSPRRPSTPRD